MATYPAGTYSPRAKENKSGVVYDAAKKTVIFVEDISKLDDEVVAIETELGTNPKGAKADVKTRLDDVDTTVAGKTTLAEVLADADIADAISKKHSQNTDTALGSGAVAADHGAAATDQIVNVCYGTGDPPAAATTTEGTLFVKYTA
jgi:hypothetical protein